MELPIPPSEEVRDLTSVLPPEVLTAVINSACKTYTDRSVGWLVRLGAVCSRWRAVMWSCPYIWTDFRCKKECRNTGALDVLDLHLKNAANLALSASVDGKMTPVILLPLLRELLAKNPDRIRFLELTDVDYSTWNIIADYSRHSDFPRLEAISCSGRSGYLGSGLCWDSRWKTHLNIPHLYSLEIRNLNSFPFYRFPLQQITELSVEDAHPDQALHLLSQCRNLVNRFTFNGGSVSAPPYYVLHLIRDIVVPRLTSFEWHLKGRINTALLSRTRLPAVRHVRLSLEQTEELAPGWRDTWKNLFLQMKHLETLEISSDAIGLVPELLALVSGQQLRTVGFRVYKLAELRKCLEYLTHGSDSYHSPFLLLESIDIGFGSKIIKRQHTLEILNAIVALITSRRPPVLPTCDTPLRCLQVSGELFIKSLSRVVDYQGVSQHLRTLILSSSERVDLHPDDMDLMVSQS